MTQKRGGQPGNTNALKHGGERAVVKIRRGDPFDGEALDIYHDKLRELGLDLDALDDIGRLLAMDVAREGAAAELYWRAFCKAYDTGDDDGLYRYGGRLAWLMGRHGRALKRLAKWVGHW